MAATFLNQRRPPALFFYTNPLPCNHSLGLIAYYIQTRILGSAPAPVPRLSRGIFEGVRPLQKNSAAIEGVAPLCRYALRGNDYINTAPQ